MKDKIFELCIKDMQENNDEYKQSIKEIKKIYKITRDNLKDDTKRRYRIRYDNRDVCFEKFLLRIYSNVIENQKYTKIIYPADWVGTKKRDLIIWLSDKQFIQFVYLVDRFVDVTKYFGFCVSSEKEIIEDE